MDRGTQTPPASSRSVRRSAWLDVDWRAYRRWVTVGGQRVNCVEIGAGPSLLLIHGLGGNWQNWLENIPHFARNHRVIAIDLPGFGESRMPREAITIDYYACWIVQLLDTLGVDRCALIGNSMGGQIAAEVTLQSPARVRQLVLVGAAGIFAENFNRQSTIEWLKRADRLFSFWSKQVVGRARRLTRRRGARRALMSLWVHHPDDLSGPLVAELAKGTGKPGFSSALAALSTHSIRARLRQIDCPVLIVWGEQDRVTSLRGAHEFHSAIRGSRLVIYADTGHLPMLERPADFNALLDDFL